MSHHTRNGAAVLVAALLAFFAGCGERRAPPPTESVATPAAAPTPTLQKTADDWKRAVSASYVELGSKDVGDGTTEFMASFDSTADGKTKTYVFGSRDAFSKVRIYTARDAELWWNLGSESLLSRVVLPDCKTPVLVLRAQYFSKSGYMFMRRVAVLVDGDVVLDEDFSNEQVHRGTRAAGVQETYSFAATDKDIESLKRVIAGKKVLVRITGNKGYRPLDKDALARFTSTTADSLIVYYKLMAATLPNVPATCN